MAAMYGRAETVRAARKREEVYYNNASMPTEIVRAARKRKAVHCNCAPMPTEQSRLDCTIKLIPPIHKSTIARPFFSPP